MKNTTNQTTKIVTFETLSSNLEKIPPVEFEDPLINNEMWKSEEFQKIFFERNKKFTGDEENLKREFYNWHKELGKKIYDIKLNQFNFIPFKITSIDITNYLKFHPLLTQRDKKNLELIRQEINNKFKRHILTNFLVGISVILTYLKIKGKREKTSIAHVVKKNYLPIMLAFFISVLWVDSRFKIYKPKYMEEMLVNKGMDKKYFITYLN